jgi:hypothetical protein
VIQQTCYESTSNLDLLWSRSLDFCPTSLISVTLASSPTSGRLVFKPSHMLCGDRRHTLCNHGHGFYSSCTSSCTPLSLCFVSLNTCLSVSLINFPQPSSLLLSFGPYSLLHRRLRRSTQVWAVFIHVVCRCFSWKTIHSLVQHIPTCHE